MPAHTFPRISAHSLTFHNLAPRSAAAGLPLKFTYSFLALLSRQQWPPALLSFSAHLCSVDGNIRQFHYFKTSYIVQLLGSYFSQPLVAEAAGSGCPKTLHDRCIPLFPKSGRKSPLSPVSLLFLLGLLKVPAFTFSPAIGFCLLY